MLNPEDIYYAAINKWNEDNSPAYSAYLRQGFIHFERKKPNDVNPDDDTPPPPPLLRRASANLGYKFHISLDAKDNNIYEGWKTVLPILAKYGINHFKIAPTGFDELNKNQRGKEITVYLINNPEIEKETWAKVLQEITCELYSHKIKPGPFPNHPERKDEKIKGSIYISYRNDNPKINVLKDPDNIFMGLDLTMKNSGKSQGFFSTKNIVGMGAVALITLVGLGTINQMSNKP